jgi:hypothetical protein
MEKDGVISMKCEFCSREYNYEAIAVEKKILDHAQNSGSGVF